VAVPPVIIDFIARGMPNVQRAFRSIEQTIVQNERAGSRASEAGARARIGSANRERREKQRLYEGLFRDVDKRERDATKAAEREARNRTKVAEREARDARRQAEQATRDARREEEKRTRDAERFARERQRIRDRSATYAGRFAIQRVNERERQQRLDGNRSFALARAAGSGAMNGARAVVRGAGALAGTVAQLGGGFTVADALSATMGLETSAVSFINSASNKSGLESRAIQARARAAGASTGMDPTDLLNAARSFQAKTGNSAEALANMGLFGEIAMGTGAKIEDVASAAGTLRVQNAKLDEKAMKQMLLQIVRQGQEGSIEFSDLAGSVGKITKSAVGYKGDQAENQAKLMGLAQIGISTAGNVSTASTDLTNILSDANKHADKMQATLGNDIFDKTTGKISVAPDEFIGRVMDKTGGNLQKISGMGFGTRSQRMFMALGSTWDDAVAAGEDPSKAIRQRMKDAVAKPMAYEELQGNVAAMRNTSAVQFETVIRDFKAAVGQQLLPEFVKLVPAVRDSIPVVKQLLDAFTRIANWASQNPFAALTSVIVAHITSSIVQAKIGETIKSLLTGGGGSSIPGGAGNPASGSAPGAAIGSAGLGATALVAGASAAQLAYLSNLADKGYAADAAGAKKAEVLTQIANSGNRAEAAAAFNQAQQDSGAGQQISAGFTFARRAMQAMNPLGIAGQLAGDYVTEKVTGKGPVDLEEAKKTIEAKRIATDEKLIEALNKNTAATVGNTGATGGGSTDPAKRSQPIGSR